MPTSRPITVTLGNQQDLLDRRLQSGAYQSASEVVRAGLLALEREDEAANGMMRASIQQAMDDPGSDIPAGTVFEELRAYHHEQLRSDERGA